MKHCTFILIVLAFTSCDFKSSARYNAEAEKLEQEGKYEEAIPFLDKAIEKDPENVYALMNRGVDKSMLKDYEGAIEDYSAIIALDADNALAYLNRGKNKNRIEDYPGAIEDFNGAIKCKGGELIYMDRVENSFFDTGFEFDVRMEEIIFERGVARYYIDSLHLAFDDFRFCIDKHFNLPDCYYWTGIIYVAYGMTDEGCADLNKSHELGDATAKEMIDRYCK